MAAALPGLKENLPGSVESVVRQLGNKPGWDEKNFQVLGKAFEVVLLLARADVGVGKREASLCIGGAADKLADPKLKCAAQPCFPLFRSPIRPLRFRVHYFCA